jgi:hypothetical protein
MGSARLRLPVSACGDVFNPSFFERVVIWSKVASNSNKAEALKEDMSIVNINNQRFLHVPAVSDRDCD